jgi:hypothetical protein
MAVRDDRVAGTKTSHLPKAISYPFSHDQHDIRPLSCREIQNKEQR